MHSIARVVPAPSRSGLGAIAVVGALLVAACGSGGDADAPTASAPRSPIGADLAEVAASIEQTAWPTDGACSGTFVAHDLPHTTSGPGDTSSTFDGTGAGVAVGDLDGDGDLDVVLPNLSEASTLARNDGRGGFTAEPLIVGRFRQASIVDVDADGDVDIVLSTGVGPPVWMEATPGDDGVPVYERRQLDGVAAATYSMAWSDLEGDGDLDLVTGSYNAELSILRNSPVLGSDTGVIVHLNDGTGGFSATRIAAEAQALAVRLVDLDGDIDLDIVVGNDLATPDGIWLDNDGGWLPIEPLTESSFSTMSLDAADVDNDGDLDLFSTDMMPMSDDPETRDRYREVDADMAAIPVPDEIQRPENVLNLADPTGAEPFTNAAGDFGVQATGWSWSGVFGDLDRDGRSDLYVVNGMRSDQLFSFLPEDRLVEENQAFRNTGTGFDTMPSWGLADTAGGRGMAMGDLDGDGDLDIVVNNLDVPSRWFENQLCGPGTDLEIELVWPDTANRAAIGALIEVSRDEALLVRTIDAARGYLSGGPNTAHVGVPAGEGPVTVSVRWPDGVVSRVEAAASGRVVITRAG